MSVSFTSVPIDALIRQHFLIDDGSVLIRNVTTSSDDYQSSHSHICYALFEQKGSNSMSSSTISNTVVVEPVPERGIVLGTAGAIFGANGTAIMTDEEIDARQEDTGEVDSSYWDIDILDQHLSSPRSNNDDVGQYNICRIRFEFKCTTNNDNDDEDENDYNCRRKLDFKYVFASQEYMDDNRGYDASTSYAYGNDAFTVLLNGQNIAMIPVLNNENNGVVSNNGVSVPVSVDSINPKTNSEYYINHKLDGQIVSANGFTVELHPYYNDANNDSAAATTTLLPEEWNVIEFTISDVGDDNINSWVFLSANSFSCKKVKDETEEQTVVDDVDDQERNTTSSVRIPLLMALTIAGLLGIFGLALPVLCLNFYNKRLPSDERFFGWLVKGW
jgi:hypothetical protein